MKPRHLLVVPLVVASAAGCGGSGERRTNVDEAPVTTAALADVCSEPQTSDDGTFALFYSCPATSNAFVRMSLGDGSHQLRGVEPGATLGTIGITHGLAWNVVNTANGGWYVDIRNLADTSTTRVRPALALASTSSAPLTVFATPDRKRLVLLSQDGRAAHVADLGASGGDVRAVSFDLGGIRAGIALSPDATNVLVHTTKELWKIDLRTSPPTLGGHVVVTLASSWSMVSDSYDGASVLARVDSAGGPPNVSLVDASTGEVRRLLSSATHIASPIVVRGAHAYLEAVTTTPGATIADTVIRLSRDPSEVSEVGIARARAIRDLVVGRNGSRVMYVTEEAPYSETLFGSMSDGSSPVPLWTQSGFVMSLSASPAGPILWEKASREGMRTYDVLDESGVRLQPTVRDDAGNVASSADGKALYSRRPCKVGAVDAEEVVGLTGGENMLVPCSIGGSGGEGSFSRVPSSSTMFYLRWTVPNSPQRQALLMAP